MIDSDIKKPLTLSTHTREDRRQWKFQMNYTKFWDIPKIGLLKSMVKLTD